MLKRKRHTEKEQKEILKRKSNTEKEQKNPKKERTKASNIEAIEYISAIKCLAKYKVDEFEYVNNKHKYIRKDHFLFEISDSESSLTVYLLKEMPINSIENKEISYKYITEKNALAVFRSVSGYLHTFGGFLVASSAIQDALSLILLNSVKTARKTAIEKHTNNIKTFEGLLSE